jgi:hypothetical protein
MDALGVAAVLLDADDDRIGGEGVDRALVPFPGYLVLDSIVAPRAAGVTGGDTKFIETLGNPLRAPARLQSLEHPDPRLDSLLVVGQESNVAVPLREPLVHRNLDQRAIWLFEEPSKAVGRGQFSR